MCFCFFFFKQKTAYEIVSRDWSSDVCSSDLCRQMAEDINAIDGGVELNGAADDETGMADGGQDQIGRASCRERV